ANARGATIGIDGVQGQDAVAVLVDAATAADHVGDDQIVHAEEGEGCVILDRAVADAAVGSAVPDLERAAADRGAADPVVHSSGEHGCPGTILGKCAATEVDGSAHREPAAAVRLIREIYIRAGDSGEVGQVQDRVAIELD